MRQFMRLEWSVLAQTDRDAIFDYIEADSPQAAIVVDNRIRVQVESLVRFPESGLAASRERGSSLFNARPTSPLIASPATPCGFCVCCTVLSSGPRICLKKRESELKHGSASSPGTHRPGNSVPNAGPRARDGRGRPVAPLNSPGDETQGLELESSATAAASSPASSIPT